MKSKAHHTLWTIPKPNIKIVENGILFHAMNTLLFISMPRFILRICRFNNAITPNCDKHNI